MARGWEIPYTHPKYSDSHSINAGTIYQTGFDKQEKVLSDELQEKGSIAHLYFSAGQHTLFDPLMGIPYPSLVYYRLKTLQENTVDYLSIMGGNVIPELVPYNINHEVIRSFQYQTELDITNLLNNIADNWAGKKLGPVLIDAWKFTEESILSLPNVTTLYTTFGFTWYRLWARPLVPDIEKIPQDERDYYEDFMCTTPHNPNNVDLSRDVLFQLTTPEKSKLDLKRIDENVWDPLNQAIAILEKNLSGDTANQGKQNVIYDQLIRIKALKCWMMTQRNIAAWITGVYGYMQSNNEKNKNQNKQIVVDLIKKEIENSNSLSQLLDSGIEFMAMTDKGETPLIYGKNLKKLLEGRIKLMKKHINDEPFIDHQYIERKSGQKIV